MSHYYAVNKQTGLLTHNTSSLANLKTRMKELGENEKDFYILQDVDMKYISRIVYVDGECIYNNKNFWSKIAEEILENFEEHDVEDFLGNKIDSFRFTTELSSNSSRISAIDGLAGEIDYNMTVGDEFIALFREECVKTDFKGITPLEIGMKLAPVISLVQTGSFREAKQVLQTIETDPFLTEERIAKYIAMMESADAIEYATKEEYYYTADADESEEIEDIKTEE